jgi:predicted enzyme related to lactoylglutathione lyase
MAAVQKDPERAATFYSGLFGWATENLMPERAQGDYIICRARGLDAAAIVSVDGAPPPPSATWATHIWVEDARATAETVQREGGTVIGAPFESPGGGVVAVLADPSGAVFCVWEPRERKGAQVVNEPGAWAMSQLITDDPERSKRFYSSVFGWATEEMSLGEDSVTLFRVPGYVGGEPQQPVSREVVAAMSGLGREASAAGVAPHWSPDFWIDNAERAAARAASLGGEVVVAPHEAPPFRRVVLADPEGATFSLSQLML